MQSLSETKWDAVISGTGLQQSLLALALSRSGLNILHVDPNDYYGGAEAALSLQEMDDWVRRHEGDVSSRCFSGARVVKHGGLSSSRLYSLALAPQIIHTRSRLLSQLVSSKAFRQIEFLAVGSLHMYEPASASSPVPSLSRIPSTREEVFSNTTIPARSKRFLMKLLKFVLEYDSGPQLEVWSSHANEPLASFLAAEFKLDEKLQAFVIALTLSLDGKVSVGAGLAAIQRHLTSMGVFGAGFAAVYPKWGGLSELAQAGCRAGAVGGTVYVLGHGVGDVLEAAPNENDDSPELAISLSNDCIIRSRCLVRGHDAHTSSSSGARLSRLTTVVDSDLSSLFKSSVDDAPMPAVSVVAFPAGSIQSDDGSPQDHPVYAMIHSADTGECPPGQCVLYLNTISGPKSASLLETARARLLAALKMDDEPEPECLYELFYEQSGCSSSSPTIQGNVVTFPTLPLDLAFNDSALESVRTAWNVVTSNGLRMGEQAEYMVFGDREGTSDEDEL